MSTELRIETGVPLPDKRLSSGTIKSVLLAMKVGESFLYPLSKRNSILPVALRLGIKIATRKVSDTELRVWKLDEKGRAA